MCFYSKPPSPPPPPPLAPPPPPPAPPTAPLPDPEPLESEVNPKVRRTKSQKDRNPQTKGTGALRIKIDPQVGGGGQTGATGGGLNL